MRGIRGCCLEGTATGQTPPLGVSQWWAQRGRMRLPPGLDTIVCSLERTFTPAEQSLVALGEHQRLRETRMFFQHASERDFRDAVERITVRKVIAFVSGTDTNADVSCEVFFLEPLGSRNGDG
jgi:hypothetical protein